jgi:3-hydroxyacyl-[acyl-carrier-protein] dehydratase
VEADVAINNVLINNVAKNNVAVNNAATRLHGITFQIMTDHQHQGLIASNHPSLPGHFPGNPVVPGVVILDEVLDALEQWQPQWIIEGFTTVKFLQPLLPDEPFNIEFEQSKASRVKFQCKKQQTVFATGIITLAMDNLAIGNPATDTLATDTIAKEYPTTKQP